MTIIWEVNMITRQMTPFFLFILWVLFVGIFHFCISRRSKFSSTEYLPSLHYVLVCKVLIYIPKMTLSSLLRWTFVFKKIANFCYMTSFVPNLILILAKSHGPSTLKKVYEHFLPSTSYLILAPSLAPSGCLVLINKFYLESFQSLF